MPLQEILRFDRFTLDLRRGELRAGDLELRLRPKSFEVLRHLVLNAGRLVSKDELAQAVWPGAVVTDDSLVQCVREVRSVLDDHEQGFIKTVPRRGYMFVAGVAVASSADVARPAVEQQPAVEGADLPDACEEGPLPRRRGQSRFFAGTQAGMRALALTVVLVVVAASVSWSVDRRSHQASPEALSIAVLPFASLGQSHDQHLSDGLAGDIITAISRFRDATVIAGNSSLRLASSAEIAKVRRELGVAYVVRGSVGRDGDRMRIHVELVDARSGATRWAERYDRKLSSVHHLQDEVAEQVVSKVVGHARHLAAENVRSRPPASLEAYELVLKARRSFMNYERAGTMEAHELMQRATRLDPGYAPAWELLARILLRLYLHPVDDRHLSVQVLEQARSAAVKAVSLDPGFSRAHAVLGYVQLWRFQYDTSLESLRQAVALNPNDADAFFYYGDALGRAGEHRASLEALDHARRLDPFSPTIIVALMARAHYMLGEHDVALRVARSCAERSPHVLSCVVMQAVAASQADRHAEAQDAANTARSLDRHLTIRKWPRRFRLDSDEFRYLEGLRSVGLLEGSN